MSSNPEAVVVQETNFSAALAEPPPSDAGRSSYGTVPTSALEPLSASKRTTAGSRAVAPDLLRGLILLLMSLDHAALFLGAWLHGTPKQGEYAGTPFTEWNFTTAYVSRTLTHLCAPGFFFLMGMGTVYFHRSRAKIGWGRVRMLRHFAVRAVALIVVNQIMAETLMGGKHMWLINIVLVGLAVDYLLTGMLCVAVDETERMLAHGIDRVSGGKDEARTPLFANADRETEQQQQHSTPLAPSTRSKTLSFWIHNVLLALFTYFTIFWNVWLSPTLGRCNTTEMHATALTTTISTPVELRALSARPLTVSAPEPGSSRFGPWFDFWFLPMQNQYVMSGFPPLGWISFCIFGMLYARIVLHKRWKPRAVIAGNLGVAVVLAALFVATRLLHFGNLSEGCLRMPEQLAHPERNQYLASIKSFFYITKVSPAAAEDKGTKYNEYSYHGIFGLLRVAVPSQPGVLCPDDGRQFRPARLVQRPSAWFSYEHPGADELRRFRAVLLHVSARFPAPLPPRCLAAVFTDLWHRMDVPTMIFELQCAHVPVHGVEHPSSLLVRARVGRQAAARGVGEEHRVGPYSAVLDHMGDWACHPQSDVSRLWPLQNSAVDRLALAVLLDGIDSNQVVLDAVSSPPCLHIECFCNVYLW